MSTTKYWNTMNPAQRASCLRLWERYAPPETYLTFRRRFHLFHIDKYFGGVVPCGIFIGIEVDGYAHS